MTKGKMRGRRPVNKNFLAAMIQNGLQGNFFFIQITKNLCVLVQPVHCYLSVDCRTCG